MPKSFFKLQGFKAFGFALILGRFVQAGAFFVMARLLDPSQMGIVAILAVLFVAFFQMTNLGFDRYIVYSKNQEGVDFNDIIDAVWTLQLLRGLIILIAVIPVFMFINQFTKMSVEVGYLLGIACVVVLFSLVHPGLSAFERGGDFSPIARARALSVSAGGISTIMLVLLWPFPWVYIVGQATSALVLVGISFYYSSRFPNISFSAKRLSEVFAFGKHIIIIAIVSFLSAQAQHGYVGVLFGSAVLGMYYTWERLVSLPREIVTQITDRIMFATASDRVRQDVPVGPAHLVGFLLIMVTMIPFNLFVWFHGDDLMVFLAGKKWLDFFWVGKFFVLISFCYSLAGTIGPYMLVSHPKITSMLRSAETLIVILLMFFLAPKYGVVGVLAAILSVIALAVVVRIFVLYRLIIRTDRSQHAIRMITIIVGLGGPILLWEEYLRLSFPAYAQMPVTLIFYVVFIMLIALYCYKKKHLLLREFSR